MDRVAETRRREVGALVLAAGQGERFGGGKQVAALAGRPLLEHTLDNAADAKLDLLVVVLGAGAEEVIGTVELRGSEGVVCERWHDGLAEPLKCGVELLSDLRPWWCCSVTSPSSRRSRFGAWSRRDGPTASR